MVYINKRWHVYRMLRRLIQYILTAIRSYRISARHALIDKKTGYYNHPVENTLYTALKTGSGVFVHWGVYESGKTTTARSAGLRLQAEGRLVILLHGYDYLDKTKTVRSWLRQRIGVPEGEEISAYLNRPTIIIVSHYDILMLKYNTDSIEAFSDLGCTVLLVVSSWERAQELRNNGCKLVGSAGCGRWTDAQLRAVFPTLSKSMQEKWTGEGRDSLLRLSILSGAVGYLTESAQSNPCERRAELLDAEWHNGIQALEGCSEIPKEWYFSLGMVHYN